MLNIEKYGNFKSIGKSKTKKQIILCHTSREVEEYLVSLKYRFNSKFDRVPNFVITKGGKILQLLPELDYTNFFEDNTINKNSIIICLENLGWLEKKQLTNWYINWKGSIYNQQVYERKWRDFFFWQPYTEEQMGSLVLLCEKLCLEFSIPRKSVGHNTKFEGIKNFDGIVSRSNYDSRFTDLNPSFDFELFKKEIEYE
jgi:hypothetical protein